MNYKTKKALKESTNQELIYIMQNACFAVCKKDTIANNNWLTTVEEELLNRLNKNN